MNNKMNPQPPRKEQKDRGTNAKLNKNLKMFLQKENVKMVNKHRKCVQKVKGHPGLQTE